MNEFRVSTNVAELDIHVIHQFLARESYWLKGVPIATLRKSIANSLCFGGFIGATQIAFGRAVTDLATFAYLRDIFVLPAYRGSGYGKLLVEAMMSRLKEEGVRSILLSTADAHGLYEKFGFRRVVNSTKLMSYAQPLLTTVRDPV